MARNTKDINADVIALVRQMQALIPLLADLQQAGLPDGGNSTDETLGAGGAFTGAWTAVGDRVQAAITVSVTAASAADGLVFEHGTDGATVLHSHSYTLAAGESRHFNEPLLMDFFRIRYTDGGAGGDLVLATKLFNSPPTAHPQGDVVHDAIAAGVHPLLGGGYASAAAPSDVSADGRAVRAWLLRNGARAVAITAAGALIPGSAADGLLVNLGANNDVTSSNKSASAALTSVAASVTSVTLLAANADRNYAIIQNDSATAVLKIKYGATASATSFTGPPIRPGMTAYIDDGYTGIIDGIWDIASGNARITELEA